MTNIKWFLALFIILLYPGKVSAQEDSILTREVSFRHDSITLKGKFCLPYGIKRPPVILMVAGSGPTDMDGNNFMMKNNHLKFLAEALAENGIASLRYNKRVIPANRNKIQEKDLVFDDFVEDAVFLLNELKDDRESGKIYILGHSQGALIATLAAQQVKVKALFLVAGPGEPIQKTLKRQISASGEKLAGDARVILDSLEAGYHVKNINPMLLSIFRPDIQGFIMSWMKYDPAQELQKVKAKTIIIQGETDIQVRKEDALRLEEMNPGADLYLIKGMNHILKNAPEDRQENVKTYSDPDLPVNEKLIEIITGYIN